MKRFLKIANKLLRISLSIFAHVHLGLYMFLFNRYLRHIGIKVIGSPKFISHDVYFDGSDYSLIQIGDNSVISREVMFLTHDYSISAGLASIGVRKRRGEGELYTLKPIVVGNDCFVGARTSLLPGASIGDNVIIGAGSVVSGHIPNDSVAVGNPCKVIARTSVWTKHKLDTEFFLQEHARSKS